MSALSGLRVVEFSAFVSAPLAGATLASLGADVIRIEQKGGGIDARRWPLHDGRSLYRAGLDYGKRSVTLDLKSRRGRDIAIDLIAASGERAGIFLTNLGARGWASYENLASGREDLIMLSIVGMPDGRPAVDYTVNAEIGFPLITGSPGDERPVNHALPAWDVSAGLFAALGILAAERQRNVTGEGEFVELSLYDVARAISQRLGFLGEALLVDTPRPRLGNDIYGSYGRNFVTGDGLEVMVVALTPRQWASLERATGLTREFLQVEELHGVDLDDEGARFTHREEISALLEPWFGQHTLEQISKVFDAEGVVWGKYRSFKDVAAADPRAAEPVATPLKLGAVRPGDAESPTIGAHTEDVLRDVLNLTEAIIDSLRSEGIID